MSSSNQNNESQNSGNAADKKPDAQAQSPTTFGALKQAVVDGGNAILCKTILSPDSERCKKKRAETLDAAKTSPPADTTGECHGGEQSAPQQAKKRSNSLNPKSSSPSDTMDFIKFFSDDGR